MASKTTSLEPWSTVLHIESCVMMGPNQASFLRLTVARRRGCCGLTSVHISDVTVGLVFHEGGAGKSSETTVCKGRYPAWSDQVSQPNSRMENTRDF
ncbi:hypothetical protein DPMN_133154 [Dreissena polymorpha]|uniref:Uncharacterized protein n=1 Tax=Dreissena polymorpha TaxID=45954 RepID=A0A9D4JEI1_DREPO|nr:hypothetical protein DPMN_133154 [Dreissena polymorpha]